MSNETEEYFIALEWEYKRRPFTEGKPKHKCWFDGDGIPWVKDTSVDAWKIAKPLPDIRDSFAQLKKWVIDKMEAEGCTPLIERLGETRRLFFVWEFELGCSNEEITNGDIPLAMIISATRYFNSKEKL